jgi:hypothetical protein
LKIGCSHYVFLLRRIGPSCFLLQVGWTTINTMSQFTLNRVSLFVTPNHDAKHPNLSCLAFSALTLAT